MKTRGSITNLERLLRLAVSCPMHYFRGQPREYSSLAPRLHRTDFLTAAEELTIAPREVPDPSREKLLVFEDSLLHNFQIRAPAFETRLPAEADLLAWLVLMQHHGAPTRLLDWTRNALCGLFFAVADYSDSDGELWALNPPVLNVLSVGLNSELAASARAPRYFAAESSGDSVLLEKILAGLPPPTKPVAISPPFHFRRMEAQAGVFTIHPVPDVGTSLKEINAADPRMLVRYLVPKKSKPALLKALGVLGVNRLALFPGLESLASSIARRHRDPTVLRRTPEEPPEFPD